MPVARFFAGRAAFVSLRFEELADGDIDLVAISKVLREAQYDGLLVVELKRAAPSERRRGLPGAAPVDMGPHVRFPKSGS